jgi:hypothetical protein
MQVPTLEQFQALFSRVQSLEAEVARLRSAGTAIQWVSREQAAEILKIKDPDTVSRLAKAGKIQATKRSRRTLINLQSIHSYILQNP